MPSNPYQPPNTECLPEDDEPQERQRSVHSIIVQAVVLVAIVLVVLSMLLPPIQVGGRPRRSNVVPSDDKAEGGDDDANQAVPALPD